MIIKIFRLEHLLGKFNLSNNIQSSLKDNNNCYVSFNFILSVVQRMQKKIISRNLETILKVGSVWQSGQVDWNNVLLISSNSVKISTWSK